MAVISIIENCQNLVKLKLPEPDPDSQIDFYIFDINQDNFVVRTNISDGKVHSISLVKSFNVVLVAGDTRLHFLRVCVRTQTWTELRSDFILNLGPNKHVSVFGPRFSASNTERFINVYEIFYVGQTVRTSLLCEIDQVRMSL